MAEHSTMVPLGTTAPDFALPDVVSGQVRTRDELSSGMPLLVVFSSRHCPYMQHCKEELARLGRDYAGRVAVVAIASNDVVAYPADAPAGMAEMSRQEGFRFPVLYDETQEVARAYSAVCTPDTFLFDRDLRLAYRGQLDPSRPGKGGADGRDVRAALDALLEARPVSPDQLPSMGCSIKWRDA